MRLIAEINDADLLLELMYEKGTSFYTIEDVDDRELKLVEVVYFSGNRCLHFKGLMNKDQLDALGNYAHECQDLELDTKMGEVRITQ